MARKKKGQADGMDVLAELKEPFSFANFFEDHVAGKVRKAKKFLEEKGILYFFLSPFTKRSRLILELAILVFGVLVGVVPRTNKLLQAAKERNAASEMASLIEKGDQYVAGSVATRPLASSQYGKQHLLAFLLSPTGNAPLPSTAERYAVRLAVNRGVADAEHVRYAWDVIPVAGDERLLLVYVDNREQDDATGIYDLAVQIANEDVAENRINPMEIVLSDTQTTTELFGAGGVDLSTLTDQVLGNDRTPIADAKAKFEQALSDYELETERIGALPVVMTASPAPDELRAACEGAAVYTYLTDESTTKDIADKAAEEAATGLSYPAAITMDGTVYDAKYLEERQNLAPQEPETSGVTSMDGAQAQESVPELTDEEELLAEELTSLQKRVDAVISAFHAMNSAAQSKYESLAAYKLLLNRPIDVAAFPETGTCLTSLPALEREDIEDESVPAAGSLPVPVFEYGTESKAE